MCNWHSIISTHAEVVPKAHGHVWVRVFDPRTDHRTKTCVHIKGWPLKENSCLKRMTMTVKLFYFIAFELDRAFRNDL